MRALLLQAAIGMGFMSVAALAQIQDVEIAASRKKLDEQKSSADGPITVVSKDISYKVTIRNRTFRTLPELKVKYMIFYQESDPGDSSPTDVSAKGSETLSNLEGNREVTFETKPFTLNTSTLHGGYYWTSGASGRQKDRVTGVWIRVFAPDGRMLGEYANPSTVSKKNQWKE